MKQILVIADEAPGLGELPVFYTYRTAFLVHMKGLQVPGKFHRVPSARPRPGRPSGGSMDHLEFYQRLIDTFNQLLAEGHPAPAREIAKRMGEPPATVRSWLRRGRVYLDPAQAQQDSEPKGKR